MNKRTITTLIGFLALGVMNGCVKEETPTTMTAPEVEQKKPPEPETKPVFDADKAKPKDGDDVAVMETKQGRIVLMFFPEVAPNHVKNFKDLANKKFYDGTRFHRVIPGFMIQGGDPNSKNKDRSTHGTGGPGYSVNAEFNEIKHVRGILSAARSQDPNSAGSQFFIMVAVTPSLDGQYSAYGKVVEGMEVADKIVALDRDGNDNPKDFDASKIISVKIEKWPLKK